MIRYLIALVLLFSATPAQAGPLAAVIPIVVGALVKSAIVKIALTIVLTVAVSALSKAMQKKPIPPGIQIERRLSGGTVSRTIILGWYATAGSEVSPAMSFGKVNKTPNSYLHTVTALADVPLDSLRRVVVNGEYVPFNASVNGEDGHPLGGKYAGRGWVKFYDGRQIAADPRLRAVYGNYLRPWDAGKVGKGVSYAVMTWLYDAELFRGEPEVKFEVYGMRLYDVRKDGTAGGVGSHRFGDPSTYEFTMNPMVMIYNILRGITFADGSKYGGECEADDLPVANWSAAMNVCDEQINTSGGAEVRYRAGFEIPVAEMQPADAIEELLKACSGDLVETGGIYKTRCGPPSLPIMFVTDADFLVNQPSDFDPFPGIASAKNTIYATYPSPDENWSQHDAPVQTDAAYLARDQGIVLSGSLSLPAVPFALQVQRLMTAWLKDDQRWRQHSASFGHYGFVLEPLDCIAWSSARNQYDNKLFEVNSCSENLATLTNTVALREVDPSDYDYRVEDELPDPVVPGNWELPIVQAVPGFGASAATVKDAAGKDRRPAIQVYWDADAADDADFIKIQGRLAGDVAATIDVTAAIVDGSRLLVEGLLPNTEYQVRGKFIADRPTEWSGWFDVATPDVRLSNEDISAEFDVDLGDALDRIDQAEREIEAIQAVGQDLQDKAEQAAQDIISLGGTVSTVVNTVSAQGASITENSTAISNLNGEYASLTQTVSTQGASISQNATAISTLALQTASLSLAVRASGSNILKNGNFENGINNSTWIITNGSWIVYDNNDGRELKATGGNSQIVQGIPSVGMRGGTFTLSADMYKDGAPEANFRIEVISFALNESSKYIGVIFHTVNRWATAINGRASSTTFTVPEDSNSLTVYITVDGPYNVVAVRKIKLELGSVATPYSAEASAIQSFQAISTLDSQYASLSSTVSTQGASISQNATAISGLNTNYASLSSTVSTQGGSITQNAQAISNLSGTVSSLSSTVSAQGASISQNATAISNVSGNVTTLFARVAVTLDVNGYITGWEANNNGSFGDFTIRADRFRIVSPSGGARTEYSDGNWRVYDANGTLRMQWGVKA